MAKTSMEIILSEDLKQRLHAIALRVGKTVQEFAQEALYTFVEDHEDGLLVEQARKEGGLTYTQQEMESEFGLESRLQAFSKKTA